MSITKVLEKLVEFQVKHFKMLAIFFLLITVFMLFGIPKLSLESDMDKSMPQDLPIYKLNAEISEKYGAQDILLVILRYDDSTNSKNINSDIRNVEVINYLVNIQNQLMIESSVDSVVSIGSVFNSMTINQQTIDYVLRNNPELNAYFSKDYTSTFLMVSSDIGGSEQKTNAILTLIDEKLNSVSKPAGIVFSVTGTPPMRLTLAKIMGSDAIYTLSIAFVLIFILLCILEKSFVKAILISTPLTIGLLWTMGTLGWIDLKISIATAGLGAMILGLGVEYGVFMLKRYHEEREKDNTQFDSLKVSVPAVGQAIIGSGLTTTVGFLALTLSMLPMMQNLGLSLAIGIFYCLFSSIFIAPIVYIIFERLEYAFEDKLFKFARKKEDEHHDI